MIWYLWQMVLLRKKMERDVTDQLIPSVAFPLPSAAQLYTSSWSGSPQGKDLKHLMQVDGKF